MNRGFTLAEILITVTLLVIISMIVLIGLNPMLQIFKGFDARRKADLYSLRTAFEAYFTDHDCYPPLSVLSQCESDALQPYLRTIPCDPQDRTPYTITLIPADSACYQGYAIYTKLTSKKDPLGSKYPECPQMMIVTSPNLPYLDAIAGCSHLNTCRITYGCQNGLCTVVARDKVPTCAPNYCDSDCGGVNCGKMIRKKFVNECKQF